MGFIREVIDAFRGVEKLTVIDRRLGGGSSEQEERRKVDRRKPVDPLVPPVLPDGVLVDRRKLGPVFGKAGTKPELDRRKPR